MMILNLEIKLFIYSTVPLICYILPEHDILWTSVWRRLTCTEHCFLEVIWLSMYTFK